MGFDSISALTLFFAILAMGLTSRTGETSLSGVNTGLAIPESGGSGSISSLGKLGNGSSAEADLMATFPFSIFTLWGLRNKSGISALSAEPTYITPLHSSGTRSLSLNFVTTYSAFSSETFS